MASLVPVPPAWIGMPCGLGVQGLAARLASAELFGVRQQGQAPVNEGLVGNGRPGVPVAEGAEDRRHLHTVQRLPGFDAP